MTSNFVPRYCTTCENSLPRTNINSSDVTCVHCYTRNSILGNTIIIEETYNKINQSMSNEVLKSLSKMPTTAKIEKTCPECGCDIMSKVHDKNFYNLICDNCMTIYYPETD